MARKDFRDTLSKKGPVRVADKSNSNLPAKRGFRYEFLAIGLIFILGIGYSYYRITKSLEFSIAKVFETAFIEPIDTVTDLKGDSKSIVGFDTCLRFNCSKGITLRNAKEFKPYVAEVGRSWFADKYPTDKALQQPVNNYVYMLRSMNNVGMAANEGLLMNKQTHDYYYRIWGI